MNTSRAGGLGKHWLLLILLCQEQQPPVHREKQNLLFCVWDPLGKPIKSHPSFFNQLQNVSKQSKMQNFENYKYPYSLHIQILAVSFASTLLII